MVHDLAAILGKEKVAGGHMIVDIKRADGAGPSTNPGFGEDDNGDEGSGDDGADWDKLEVEED